MQARAGEDHRQQLRQVDRRKKATQWYSVFASGPGIFGLGNRVYADDAIFAAYDPSKTDLWSLTNPERRQRRDQPLRLAVQLPGGVRHRLPAAPAGARPHRVPAVGRRAQPDPEQGRRWSRPSAGRATAGDARARPRQLGALAWGGSGWACSRCRTIRSSSRTSRCRGWAARAGKIDVAALDLIRDRERGVPRFNEFRRQYGLRQLTSFDDFVDTRLPKGSPERAPSRSGWSASCARSTGSTGATPPRSSPTAQVNADGSRSTTASGIPTAPWSTTSRTSTRWSAGWRSSPGPTASPSPRRSSRCSSSTPRAGCSATASSPRASGRSSTRTSAWSG